MKMRMALMALLLMGTAAYADPVSAPAPASAPAATDWAPNEVVEVVKQAPGPAFWHIKKGDSEIYILGMVAPRTQGVTYNEGHLVEVLKGARVVLTPPSMSAGIVSVGWFFLMHGSELSMSGGKRLSDSLPPDLRSRFLAAKASAKLEAKDLEDASPIYAAARLQGAYTKAHRLGGGPGDIVALAKKQDVPVKSIGDYDAMETIREMAKLPEAGQQKCLSDMVDYTERSAVHAGPLTEAWAVGDIKGIKAHYITPPFGECVKQASAFGKIGDRATADYLKAIREALSKPGKVVMLTDIGSLLRSTGVAEVLHKEGLTIEGPAE